ncbi:hypothetical protein [Wenjunlia tyrosinilytica]
MTTEGGALAIAFAEDAVVTLAPGPNGAVSSPDEARCGCLLAPRCLHRAAALGACPIADPDLLEPQGEDPGAAGWDSPAPLVSEAAAASGSRGPGTPGPGTPESEAGPRVAPPTAPEAATTGSAASAGSAACASRAPGSPAHGPTAPGSQVAQTSPGPGSAADASSAPATATVPSAARRAAACGLWAAAAAVLVAGAPGAGAVLQAELLRAAHTARLAGLLRAEASALRVVRGLRAARDRHDGHRLADLVAALHELLLTTARLRAADPDPSLIGTARRAYQPGGALKVYGICREPVISATGYGGVVTHLVTEDGRRFTVSDVKPGGPARARGAATAPVALCTALDHSQLARGGMLVSGSTVSPDGRLGAGRAVRANPVPGLPWSSGPLASLFGRPLAEAVGARLAGAGGGDPERAETERQEPLGCDLVVVGPAGDHVLAHELTPDAPLIRLVPASSHPDLAHTGNLRLLASRPGIRIRVVGRPDLDRTATLRPLAVGPVPGEEVTLRLPEGWLGRADLGYDRLQGSHLPPRDAEPVHQPPIGPGPDPLADSPLWRVRRLVELAVTGGRRAVAEASRGGTASGEGTALRGAGFRSSAVLAGAFTAEADRRGRDAFGRLTDPDPGDYARAWLAVTTHLAEAERALVRASWTSSATALGRASGTPGPALAATSWATEGVGR